jgi:hypothetical protein
VWTDPYLSIIGACCILIVVVVGEEQAQKVYASGPPSVEQASMLGSRDPVDDGVKCGSHGDENSKPKSWAVSWLNLKTQDRVGMTVATKS